MDDLVTCRYRIYAVIMHCMRHVKAQRLVVASIPVNIYSYNYIRIARDGDAISSAKITQYSTNVKHCSKQAGLRRLFTV